MPNRRPAIIPKLPERIVSDRAGLSEALETLRACTHIGFDTEFVGEDTYRPDLCLIQIATPDQLYLIDPLTCGNLDDFWELMVDPARLVIVHSGREEIRMCHFGIGRPPAHVFDVQIAAGLTGLTYPIGYAGLVQEILGLRAQKGQTLTDWRRRPLTASQQKYAFDDVRYLIPIWKRLSDRLKKLNREDWAAEEFAAFLRRGIADEPLVEKWRKIKGAGGLDRTGLAVARELYLWRERVAARQNRPARTVLRDDLLADLARRAPTRTEDISSMRGVPKTEVSAIQEAIRKARSLDSDQLPEQFERENDPANVVVLANLLGIVLSNWCSRNQVAASLVANVSDLKQLARSRQPHGTMPAQSQLMTGWRQRAVLPELEAFLDGKRMLRVEDPTSPHPVTIATIPPPQTDSHSPTAKQG